MMGVVGRATSSRTSTQPGAVGPPHDGPEPAEASNPDSDPK
eukprot:gene6690-4788_t